MVRKKVNVCGGERGQRLQWVIVDLGLIVMIRVLSSFLISRTIPYQMQFSLEYCLTIRCLKYNLTIRYLKYNLTIRYLEYSRTISCCLFLSHTQGTRLGDSYHSARDTVNVKIFKVKKGKIFKSKAFLKATSKKPIYCERKKNCCYSNQ